MIPGNTGWRERGSEARKERKTTTNVLASQLLVWVTGVLSSRGELWETEESIPLSLKGIRKVEDLFTKSTTGLELLPKALTLQHSRLALHVGKCAPAKLSSGRVTAVHKWRGEYEGSMGRAPTESDTQTVVSP